MFPSPSKTVASNRGPARCLDEQQSPPSVHLSLSPVSVVVIPFSASQSQSNYGSSGVSVSPPFVAGPPPSNYQYPPPFPSIIHHPPSTDDQVQLSYVQRSREPSIPPSTPSPPRYTSGFFPILNQGSPPVPRLRPASWGSPSQVDEGFDDCQLTRSRSSAEFGRHLGGDEEDLPFGTRTLPPPPTHYDPRRLAAYTTSNASSSSSREGSTDSWDVSTTDSFSAAPSLLNYPYEGYGQSHGSFVYTDAGCVTRRSSDQPEASTSSRPLRSASPSVSLSGSVRTNRKLLPKPGRADESQQGAAQSRRQPRDTIPEPAGNNSFQCRWPGCPVGDINYEKRVIIDHVRMYHGGDSQSNEPITCRWVRWDSQEECGSQLKARSLARHTLDLHTNLIMIACACGRRFRKDTLSRHKCGAQESS